MFLLYQINYFLFYFIIVTATNNNNNNTLIDDYYDLIIPCQVESTGNVGVTKDLRHCPSLLEASLNGEIIPRLCNYEICKDLVCCPINTNRLNQICAYFDDPRNDIHEKISNQNKCTIESTGEIGVLSFKYLCKTETTQKICDYRECEDAVCCPLNKTILTLQGYDITFQHAEIIGEQCHEETTNSNGICRFAGQCPQSLKLNYTICGTDHCSNIRCCPEPNPNTINEINCGNYKKFIYDRIKPLTKLIPPPEPKDEFRCYQISYANQIDPKPKEFPSMAVLGYQRENKIIWNCSGTLISDFYVLTSANCLFDGQNGENVKYVRIGVFNVIDRFQGCPEEFLVESITVHPDYRHDSIYNNIGLIRLNHKVNFNSFTVPACLPQPNDFELLSGNDVLLAVGWKLPNHNNGAENLIKVPLQYYNNSECSEIYRSNTNINLPDGIQMDKQFCAGSRNDDQKCLGGFGNPIFIPHKNFYRMKTIIGISSFGQSCNNENPGIYTMILPFIEWIENIVWSNQTLNNIK